MLRRDFRENDGRRSRRVVLGMAVALVTAVLPAFGQAGASRSIPGPAALAQLRSLEAWKSGRTAAERRVDSELLFAIDRRAGRLEATLARIAVAEALASGAVEIDIDLRPGTPSAKVAEVIAAIGGRGGRVEFVSERFASIRAVVAVDAVVPLAGLEGVRRIVPARRPFAQTIQSEGDRTHGADLARQRFGLDGAGRKICALSNGVASLAYSQSTGELPAVDVLPGQAGSGDEGTAMLEILHDVAPAASLGFATAFGGIASFAQNVLDLAAAGCQIVVDDVIYLDESPFQDGPIASAVDAVSAAGVLYLASAGNEGNLDDGTSGTWEGDFLAGAGLPVLPGLTLHDFGGTAANRVLKSSPAVALHWPDPFGSSANDYDLYVLDETLDNVVRFSNNTQDGIGGDDDPVEIISFFGSGASLGEHLVVARAAGEARLLNLIAFRGELEHATRAALRGHAAAVGALAIAAAPAAAGYGAGQPSGPFPAEFEASQLSETFSADGPRRIFFSAAGQLLDGAPANDFSSTGGVVRAKPELTSADGVATSVDGFTRFFGTSAAAPHAAALAGLYWTAVPLATAAEVRSALLDHALDIETPGPDPTTGSGIVDLDAMLDSAGVAPRANLALGAVVPIELTGNGDTVLDPGERFRLEVTLENVGGAGALAISGVLSSDGADATIEEAFAAWPDLAAGGGANGSASFVVALPVSAACGAIAEFSLDVTYAGGIAPQRLGFALTLGAPGTPESFHFTGPPVFIADTPVRGTPGPAAIALLPVAGLGGRLTDLDLSFDGDPCSTEPFATTVGIEHPFVSNLLIELVSPSGVIVPVIRFTDGFGNHFCQTVLDDESPGPSIQTVETGDDPFTGSFRPAQPLALFDGEEANGTWQLRVTDWNPLDVGRIRAFTLTATPAVCRGVPVEEIPATDRYGLVALAALVAGAALWRLSRAGDERDLSQSELPIE